jgi:Uma2 family endonuclease
LIEGEIVKMSPIGDRHANSVRRLTALFARLADQAVLSVQSPLRLNDLSEPQPDLALLRPRPDFYVEHPRPSDVLLLVEVADASLVFDRRVKAPLYGMNGIAELWVVDLEGRAIEVYRKPSVRGYPEVRRCERGSPLGVLAFPEIELSAAEILG